MERIKAEEAALIQQKRELFLAETRKVDHMERKVYSTKVEIDITLLYIPIVLQQRRSWD